MAALDPPVLTGSTFLALRMPADTPGGVVTISPSPAPVAASCEAARRASNAKCLGELSTSCPLATDTLLNSRNQTILPASTRHKDEPPPTHRSIQDANYHNQIVKEPTGASLTSLSSANYSPGSRVLQHRCPLIDRGRTRFALALRLVVPAIEPGLWLFWSAIFYRSTNQQSVAPALGAA